MGAKTANLNHTWAEMEGTNEERGWTHGNYSHSS